MESKTDQQKKVKLRGFPGLVRTSLLVLPVCTLMVLPNHEAPAFGMLDAYLSAGSADVYANTPISQVSENLEKIGIGAQDFVRKMGTQALGFLANTNMTQTQKEAAFRKLLESSFDLNTIGRFTLGRYWRTATEAQRREFLKYFREMVVNVYAARFHEYRGEAFDVRSYQTDGEKDTIVTSYIVPGQGPEVQVDWRVRYKNGEYRIVDVIVEGVSMSVTQRSDFAAVIQRGGGDVSVLISYLQQ